MSELALVTGATGLVGQHLVRRLVQSGVPVRCLVRRPELVPDDVRRCLQVAVGDVRSEEAVAEAVRGVHTVFHLAACTKAWSRDPKEFRDINVGAVDLLLNQAARQGVRRFIHVSTILTLPPYRRAPLGAGAQRLTPYEVTKREGEHLVEGYAAAGGHAVIVHPTRVYGPGPLNDANGVTRAIALYVRGSLRVRLADRDVLGNYVHAGDVAEGLALAGQRGRPGAHYVLGGENIAFRDLLELVGELAGVRRWVVPLPPAAALLAAGVAVQWARVSGRALITPQWVRTFFEDRRADIGRARGDLGYAPRSLRDGLRQTIAWLRDSGYVR